MEFLTVSSAASANPIISAEFILKFVIVALVAVVIIVVGGMILVGIALYNSKHDIVEPVRQLVEQGEVIKIMAVVFIVSAATILAMMGIVKGEAIVSILSGVAGYVLGSTDKKDKVKDSALIPPVPPR